MGQPTEIAAAVQGAPSAVVQDLFRAFVGRWQSSVRIAGMIEEGHGLADRACSAGRLRSIVDGSLYPIFQDLGPGSTACHLDGRGALTAGEAVRRDLAAGCDLVILSKFGKLEAGREGLAAAFTAAIEAGVPVLTCVSPTFCDAWMRFASPLSVVLPAQADAIDGWWRAVRSRAERERGLLAHEDAAPGRGAL
jgi:hypothetical protein